MTEFGHVVPGPLKNPGPANYEPKPVVARIKYSLRPKTRYLCKLNSYAMLK